MGRRIREMGILNYDPPPPASPVWSQFVTFEEEEGIISKGGFDGGHTLGTRSEDL